jgi:intracellular septation protein
MQLLFDFLPIIAFVAAFKFADMYVATVVFIVACGLQVAAHWLRTRTFNKMHLITAGFALAFGGLTLVVHDTTFIKWKFTIVNWLFAAAFLGSMWRRYSDRPMVQRITAAAGAALTLSEAQWRRLNLVWAGYFLLMGTANLVALRFLNDDDWMDFKFYSLGVTAVFIVAQSFWIASRAEGHDKPAS